MEINKDLESKLREGYEDCLKLREGKDLSEFGKGELFVLKVILI